MYHKEGSLSNEFFHAIELSIDFSITLCDSSVMTDFPNAPITKADLEGSIKTAIDGLRTELVQHVDEMLDNKLSTLKKEIISAFRMTEENIRKETAHADEVSALDDRLKHVEAHIGINEL